MPYFKICRVVCHDLNCPQFNDKRDLVALVNGVFPSQCRDVPMLNSEDCPFINYQYEHLKKEK